MAIRLSAWLEDTFATELLLGNSWLQQKHVNKELGLPPDPDSRWAGLYRDNGSSFDILNTIHPERNSNLQLLQNSRARLTLSDGRCEVPAQFTAQCLQDLRARYPHSDITYTASLGPVIAVRRYAIRYTSYGPPRDQLHLILHAVDWVACNYTINRVRLTPILSSGAVRAVLKQLHDTRARQDDRCLGAEVKAEVGEGPGTQTEEMSQAMEHSDGASAGEVAPHTQLAYGTQISHAIRPRVVDEEPQLVGVNRMEPVLAGNTQRKELRPKAVSSKVDTRTQLLGLLSTSGRQCLAPNTSTSANESVRASPNDQRCDTIHSDADESAQPPVTAHQLRTPSEAVLGEKRQAATSPEPSRGSKRVRDPEPILPEVANIEQNPEKADFNRTNLDQLVSTCSWMAGLKLTHATMTVPNDQQYILRQPESWRRPLPGNRFPDHNIPSKTWQFLWRLADETAAEQVDANSESEIDPSPDSTLGSVDPSPDSILQGDEDQDLSMSQMYWSASPSPELPSGPLVRSPHALPPDSSFEAAVATEVDHNVQCKTASNQGSPEPIIVESSKEQEPSVPQSSPPIIEAPKDHDEGTDMEMEVSVPQGLGEDIIEKSHTRQAESRIPGSRSPRSKSVVQVKETPYVKRSDRQTSGNAKLASTQEAEANSPWKNSSSTSIVLGTYNEPSPFDCEKDSRFGRPSAVGTWNQQDIKEELCVGSKQQTSDIAFNRTAYQVAQTAPSLDSTKHMEASHSILEQEDSTPQAQTTQTEAVHPDRIASPAKATLASAIMPAEDLSSPSGHPVTSLKREYELPSLATLASPKRAKAASESTKRKMDDSPSRKSSRHSKRRGIKIVGFGDDIPSPIDTIAALRREREESLSRFRVERKFSASFVERPGSAHKTQALQDDVEMVPNSPDKLTNVSVAREMSPRHLSLYEDPSPIERPSTSMIPAKFASRSFDGKDQSKSNMAVLNREEYRDLTDQQVRLSSEDSDPRVLKDHGKESTQNKQENFLPMEQVQSSTAARDFMANDHDPMTVFQRFKEAYPEYTGDIEHFTKQCTQMYTLDLEDRMVPKWQWDDFVVRSLTDFKDYAIERLTRGQDVGEYIHFYKNNVRGTKFQKDIIVDRDTLIQVLEENDFQSPTPEYAFRQHPVLERTVDRPLPPARIVELPPTRTRTIMPPTPSKPSPRNPKPSRASLPDPSNHHKTPTQDRINRTTHNHSRHSLPMTSHKTLQPKPNPRAHHIHHSSTTRSTPRPNLLSRLTVDASPLTRTPHSREFTPSTRDAYREYVAGWQRMTSFTGSSAVDATAQWPQNLGARRSIADVPRGKHDVLGWRDEL